MQTSIQKVVLMMTLTVIELAKPYFLLCYCDLLFLQDGNFDEDILQKNPVEKRTCNMHSLFALDTYLNLRGLP